MYSGEVKSYFQKGSKNNFFIFDIYIKQPHHIWTFFFFTVKVYIKFSSKFSLLFSIFVGTTLLKNGVKDFNNKMLFQESVYEEEGEKEEENIEKKGKT